MTPKKQLMKVKFIGLILLFCLFGLNVRAQETTKVNSFLETTQHIPLNDRRSDLNGDPCALVKVQVVDNISRVEGNKIGDIVNKGVEKWIFMCKGSRNMKIHLKNNLPVTVKFRDYKINGLESNRVYELILDVPKKQDIVPVHENNGVLQMKVFPTQATISIWGDNFSKQSYRPQDDGTLTIPLVYGRYHYIAKAEDFQDKEGSVFVNDENRWEDVRLEPEKAILTIMSYTKKVDFYIDGVKMVKKKHSNEWSGDISIGKHVVEGRRKGYVTKYDTVYIAKNETRSVNFEHLTTKFKQKLLSLKMKKDKMKEEKKSNSSNLEQVPPPNPQTISINPESSTKDINVGINGNLLTLYVSPFNSNITIDEKTTLRADEDGELTIPLSYGIHKIMMEADGYTSKEVTINIKNSSVSKKIKLSKLKIQKENKKEKKSIQTIDIGNKIEVGKTGNLLILNLKSVEGTKITVDDYTWIQNNPMIKSLQYNLAYGIHKVKAECDGYEPLVFTVNIGKSKVKREVKLKKLGKTKKSKKAKASSNYISDDSYNNVQK